MIIIKIIAALFISSLIHECGHWLFAIYTGAKVNYMQIFGGKVLLKLNKLYIGCIPLYSFIDVDVSTLDKRNKLIVYSGGVVLQLLFCFILLITTTYTGFAAFLIHILLCSIILNILPVGSTDGTKILDA